MKFARQTQDVLDRLDGSLSRLHTMIKRGEQQEALRFMEEGELKDRFEELQNLITISGGSGALGAGGTTTAGTF